MKGELRWQNYGKVLAKIMANLSYTIRKTFDRNRSF
jgi:hypothetical protein